MLQIIAVRFKKCIKLKMFLKAAQSIRGNTSGMRHFQLIQNCIQDTHSVHRWGKANEGKLKTFLKKIPHLHTGSITAGSTDKEENNPCVGFVGVEKMLSADPVIARIHLYIKWGSAAEQLGTPTLANIWPPPLRRGTFRSSFMPSLYATLTLLL